MKIITNNHERQLIYGYELTESERADFDYLDDIDTHNFFRYQGFIYDPSEFMAVPTGCTPDLGQKDEPIFQNWHGYQSDSYFSGILIRYSEDQESVVVGTYIS